MTTNDLLRLIVDRLKKFWYVILLAAIICSLLMVLYARTTPITYTSKATIFSLSGGTDASVSALSAILGAESSKGFSDETSINIIELSQSRTTREAVAAMRIPSMGNKLVAQLLEEDVNTNRSWLEPEVNAPTDEKQLIVWGGKVLESAITATINKNNSFVLTYTGRSEPLVKIISYGIIDKISKFYIDLKIDKARTDFAFASKKVDSLRAVMNGKDNVMIARDKKSLFTPTDRLEYRMPYENMLADKQMIRTQYAQAVTNQQMAAYSLQKATPIIRVLDQPDPPYDKDSHSAVIFGIVGLFAGLIFGSMFLVSGLILKYGKLEAERAIYGKSATSTTATSL
ncbi:MAG: Wzz/FepE/Etk N-terminal domain-containing protein [Ginsengibacter sp.]